MDGGLCMGDNYFLLTNLLSEDERKVIASITAHIERGEKRAGIQQIAAENYLSTASIIKMCKRLGFDGYSELYYHLSRQLTGTDKRTEDTLGSFVDNYSDALVSSFCELLRARRKGKFFTTGEGFSNIVGAYIVQRMSICGVMAFSNVHFYDYMIFQEAHQSADADESAIMFAVSQSGETADSLAALRLCRERGVRTLAVMSIATGSIAAFIGGSFPTLSSSSTARSRRWRAVCRICFSGISF